MRNIVAVLLMTLYITGANEAKSQVQNNMNLNQLSLSTIGPSREILALDIERIIYNHFTDKGWGVQWTVMTGIRLIGVKSLPTPRIPIILSAKFVDDFTLGLNVGVVYGRVLRDPKESDDSLVSKWEIAKRHLYDFPVTISFENNWTKTIGFNLKLGFVLDAEGFLPYALTGAGIGIRF